MRIFFVVELFREDEWVDVFVFELFLYAIVFRHSEHFFLSQYKTDERVNAEL